MGLGTWIFGWGAIGFATRCYQLALMNRNMMAGFHWHLVSTGFWGFAGYHLYYFNENNLRIIEAKKLELARRRGFLPYPDEEDSATTSE